MLLSLTLDSPVTGSRSGSGVEDFGQALTDDHARRMGVARGDGRHDRVVGDAQSGLTDLNGIIISALQVTVELSLLQPLAVSTRIAELWFDIALGS
jgi:hypothetical protein